MTGVFLDKTGPLGSGGDDASEKGTNAANGNAHPSSDNSARYPGESEAYFLQSFKVAEKVLHRRRGRDEGEIADFLQAIALRLWKWKEKYRERTDNLTNENWRAVAARTAFNELKRNGTSGSRTVPIDLIGNPTGPGGVEGQTYAEIQSLVKTVWQEICCLTLRQRQALLLHSQELVVYLLRCGVSNQVLAESVGLTLSAWLKVARRLPLSDIEIAKLIKCEEDVRPKELIAKSVRKARREARIKLEILKK